MTSRTSPSPSSSPGAQAGFTLLEVLVVVLLLGLVAGIVLQRGPVRSPALDLRAAGQEMARTLRTARATAIAGNRAVVFRMDVPGHAYAVDGGARRVLPGSFGIGMVAVAPGSSGGAGSGTAISFAPDGSATSGRIAVSENGRSIEVAVDWLTGRVSLSPLRVADAK